MRPHLIILDVSGRKYQTQKATLQTSPYFQNLLARWDDCTDRQEDGSYFIDADPDAFQYILEFMRRPSKFPLFWTKETSFNYALYNKLEAEADYFFLHDLRDWLRKKRYLDAVKTIIEVKALSEHQLEDGRNQTRCEADTEVQSFFGSYSGETRYRSPCGGRSVVVMPIVVMPVVIMSVVIISVVIIIIVVPCCANGIAMGIAVVAVLRHSYRVSCCGYCEKYNAEK